VRVELTVRARFEEPAVESRLTLEVNGTLLGSFTAPPDAPTVRTFRVPPDPQGRPWRRGINRLALRSIGTARINVSDSRPPGPIAASRGARPWPVAVYRVRVAPEPAP
jgi:hypothetical protein